jgi:hypothetical protein
LPKRARSPRARASASASARAPRGALARLQEIGGAQHRLERRVVAEHGNGFGRRHVEVDGRRDAGGARDAERFVRGRKRHLVHLGREPRAARDEGRVLVAHVRRGRLRGRRRIEVDGALAARLDEDRRDRARRAVEHEVVLDAGAIHRGAQDAAVLVVGALAEDAGAQPERARPAELVQDHAADEGAHRRTARAVDRLQRSLFVGTDDARRAVDAVHDHRADGDEVELSCGARHPADVSGGRRRARWPSSAAR